MVNINKLYNNQNNRIVRATVTMSGETVKIFEPSLSDFDKILELQQQYIEDTSEFEVKAVDVIKTIIPLLTDIEGMEDISDEELEEIINNPTLLLLSVVDELEVILFEVYKTVISSNKKHVTEMEFKTDMYQFNAESFNRIISSVEAKDNENLTGKIKELSKTVEEAYEANDQKELKGKVAELKDYLSKNENKDVDKIKSGTLDANKVEVTGVEPKGMKSDVLSQYKNVFADKEDVHGDSGQEQEPKE